MSNIDDGSNTSVRHLAKYYVITAKMVSYYIGSSRLSTRGKFISVWRPTSAQCIEERILQKSRIQDGGYSKLLVLLSIMTSSVYIKNLSWKISLKTFITTLGFNDIYVLFMCKTLHKSLLLPINIGYITVESLSHQGRSPIWGSSFSASSLANICQNEGRQYL